MEFYDTKLMDDAVRKLAWKRLEKNTVVERPEDDYACCLEKILSEFYSLYRP